LRFAKPLSRQQKTDAEENDAGLKSASFVPAKG